MSETKFKIFKYNIGPEKFQVLQVHRSARVLDVQMQIDAASKSTRMVLWAIVNPDDPTIERRLAMVDTGEEVPVELLERFEPLKTVQVIEPRMTPEQEVVPKSVVYHLFLEREVNGSYDPTAN